MRLHGRRSHLYPYGGGREGWYVSWCSLESGHLIILKSSIKSSTWNSSLAKLALNTGLPINSGSNEGLNETPTHHPWVWTPIIKTTTAKDQPFTCKYAPILCAFNTLRNGVVFICGIYWWLRSICNLHPHRFSSTSSRESPRRFATRCGWKLHFLTLERLGMVRENITPRVNLITFYCQTKPQSSTHSVGRVAANHISL